MQHGYLIDSSKHFYEVYAIDMLTLQMEELRPTWSSVELDMSANCLALLCGLLPMILYLYRFWLLWDVHEDYEFQRI